MQSRKKNLVIAAVIAGVLSVAAGTVAAQDYFFPLFSAYVDHASLAIHPAATRR